MFIFNLQGLGYLLIYWLACAAGMGVMFAPLPDLKAVRILQGLIGFGIMIAAVVLTCRHDYKCRINTATEAGKTEKKDKMAHLFYPTSGGQIMFIPCWFLMGVLLPVFCTTFLALDAFGLL